MANLPLLKEDQIMQLQANGKITPVTADLMRSKQVDPLAIPEAVVTPPLNAEKFSEAQKFNFPDFMRSDDFNKSKEVFQQGRVPSAVGEVEPIEKIDVSQLATAAKPQAPAAPIDYMKQSGLGSALNMQQRGVRELGQAQAEGAEAQAQEFENLAKASADFDLQVKDIREKREVERATLMDRIGTIQKENAAKAEINPNRFWENKTTGGKITSAIAIMLGALGGVMTGQGGNAAMDIINKSIDQDINAQKDAYEKGRTRLQDEKSTYATVMDEYGNKEMATLAARASNLQAVDLKLKAIAARTNSGQARAQAEIKSGEIQEEIGKLNMGIGMQAAKTAAVRGAMSGPGVEDPGLLPEDMQKRAVKMPNGLYKPAINEQAAKDINEISIAADSMKNILGKMKELNSPALPYSEKIALAGALKTEYILQKKTAEKLGVLSQVDKEMVESTLGDPGGWRPGKTESLIKLAEDNLDKKMDLTYSQLVPGYKPIKKTKAPDMRK